MILGNEYEYLCPLGQSTSLTCLEIGNYNNGVVTCEGVEPLRLPERPN